MPVNGKRSENESGIFYSTDNIPSANKLKSAVQSHFHRPIPPVLRAEIEEETLEWLSRRR